MDDLSAGKAGEHLVCADLIMKGYTAFLSYQGLPYDVLMEFGSRLLKIQVKTTRGYRTVPQRANVTEAHIFHVHRCGKGGRLDYQESGVDLFALVALNSRTIGYLTNKRVSRAMVFRCDDLRGQYHDERINARRGSILKDHASGMRNADIARKYGMNPSVVGRTIKNPTPVKMTNATYLSELTLEEALRHAS